nr:glutamate-5-semialdehyde dehydrogenase [Muribaculaceae bacterium]
MNETDIRPMLEAAGKAAVAIGMLSDDERSAIIMEVADAIESSAKTILDANMSDLVRMDPKDPRYDRLALTPERIQSIAADARHVAKLPSPLTVIERRTLPNGLRLRREAVPFGVIGVIYEARPNVSLDVFCICFKAGNAVVLKGGSDAAESNKAITGVIRSVLERHDISGAAATLLPSSHEATAQLMHARGLVDLLIPRGSRRLIDRVREEARIPVIETGAGVCHTYVEKTADLRKATDIVCNGKTRRVSVCNALDCLLIERSIADSLPSIAAPLAQYNVVIWADEEAFRALSGHYPADLLRHAEPEHFGTEFLDYAMAVKTVAGTEEAIAHINKFGSGHSEAIVTSDDSAARLFTRMVDAACVYVNAPTSFTDGAQFGLGAEIGISTLTLHSRGPMALMDSTTYK